MQSPQVHSDELIERAHAFMRRHYCLALATDGPEGLWAATVFYVNRGFILHFVSREDARHTRNIDSDHRVAATIHDDAATWRTISGLQLEGVADRVDESQTAEVIDAFRARFVFADSLWWTSVPARSRQHIYRVRPSRVLFVDHDLGPQRFEIPVEHLRVA
jgi:uncharacterized protein YhbP (UPF0306 family)